MDNCKKIYGTTLLIGVTFLETIYGKFTTYTFQDVIDRKYIMALVYGNLKKDSIYTRIHSSCLTSETLRSMDCDCVNQLYGALNKIAEYGTGVLFYILQSGRGASYISKSRGCQLVQYNQNNITTFDAYKKLGLKDDYRDYRNVKDICIMLNIDKKQFHLMTNNPNKISDLQNLGLNITNIVSLHFPTNPFNRKYLLSKQQSGHLLYYNKEKVTNEKVQPSIKPFEPYHLKSAQRFIHCSTYYIPVKPVDNRIIINPVLHEKYSDKIISSILLPSGDFLAKFYTKDVTDNIIAPYWFKTFLYYDIASHSEYIVMEYGDDNKIPIVRFHCEFIFNRFPLEDVNYKNRFKHAVSMSVKNNSGIIIIANHNGDNTSIGKYILENTSFEKTGIPIKKKLLPLTLLLKHHLKNRPIRVLYSDTSRPEMEQTFEKSNIDVKEWICINNIDKKGHTLMRNRIEISINYLKNIYTEENIFYPNSEFIVTGIGSSETHAKFFIHLAHKNNHHAKFVPFSTFLNNKFKEKFTDNKYLVIITQGLSPHSTIPINYALKLDTCENVFLLTSVTINNKNDKKVKLLEEFSEKDGNIMNFPLEDEYTLLMRIIGPLTCFFIIYHMFSPCSVNNMAIIDKIKQSELNVPNSSFTRSVAKYDNIIIILPQHIVEYCGNIKHKLIEGAFIDSVLLIGDMDFAHGTYQYCMSLKKKGVVNIVLINCKDNKLRSLVKDTFNTSDIMTYYDNELCILELENIFNKFVMKIILDKNIDQINWPGKNTQTTIYNHAS
jgi:3,4-dihydroxy 2-butanone 4-phosphate synthase / GTP cyclohydrolase II